MPQPFQFLFERSPVSSICRTLRAFFLGEGGFHFRFICQERCLQHSRSSRNQCFGQLGVFTGQAKQQFGSPSLLSGVHRLARPLDKGHKFEHL